MDNKLNFVFVHGLAGWGSYEFIYRFLPYWGLLDGDLISFLREKGFQCCAASVDPTGSAWDRACELYAQIAGKRVDYGEAHSRIYGHKRYGKDFSCRSLISEWNDGTRLVLIGHSFGGTTARLFAELLAHGDERERNRTDATDLSELFSGGMAGRIHSIVTLTTPHNGTTVFEADKDKTIDQGRGTITFIDKILAKLVEIGSRPKKDGRADTDHAEYDMHVDRASELNRRISTLPDIYYFSVPCSTTVKITDREWYPVRSQTEPMFIKYSCRIGRYSGKTEDGFQIEERWRENDGLVNTLSAAAPLSAPQKELDAGNIDPGIWNVLPTYIGDHLSLQGGLIRRHKIKDFYLNLLNIVEKTYCA